MKFDERLNFFWGGGVGHWHYSHKGWWLISCDRHLAKFCCQFSFVLLFPFNWKEYSILFQLEIIDPTLVIVQGDHYNFQLQSVCTDSFQL